MKSVYSIRQRVGASMCDSSGRLGLSNTFALFQDIASEHAEEIGVGFAAMRARGSFWLTVRTRVRFHRRPALMEPIEARTWAHAPGATRCDRFYRMTAGEELLAEGRTEWCVYDIEKGAVRPMAEAGFDPDFTFCEDTVLDAPYARFRHDFAQEDRVCTRTVRASDVDLGQHMNNVVYLRLLTDTFSAAELKEMNVREMEILFCLPCFEGQALEVMRRETEYGYEFGVRRPDGRYAALALMRAGK